MAAFWSGYALGSRRKEAIEADADSVDVMAESCLSKTRRRVNERNAQVSKC